MTVKGYDFEAEEKGAAVNWDELVRSLDTTGMQATEIGRAVSEIKTMIQKREKGMKIVLAFTSNLISSGLREIFADLANQKLIDCVITTAGGVEEDFIKCLGPTVLGEFSLDGADLRSKGLNRIANLLVPNDNYCKFEDWFKPVVSKLKDEQDNDNVAWTPSKMIHRFGKEINDKTSFYYQCAMSNIPVFSPSLTDGSIGDMLFFNAFKNPGLVLDTAGDMHHLSETLKSASSVGIICLGGGLPKHHSLQAARMPGVPELQNFVLINTGQHFDGSETGMTIEDDISAGRLNKNCSAIRLHSEATLVFPIIMNRVLKD